MECRTSLAMISHFSAVASYSNTYYEKYPDSSMSDLYVHPVRRCATAATRYFVGIATTMTRGRRATREISEIFGHFPRIPGNRLEGNFGGIIPEFEEHN